MTVLLVVMLFLSPQYGGTIKASLEFDDMASCKQFTKELKALTVKHGIVLDCHRVNS